MALLHQAELRPSKLELVAAWLPGRDWYEGPGATDLERVAAYRFDDPAGEVGMETLLVRAGGEGPVYQVPLTYRGSPLPGGEEWLIDTMEHSVLGRRWVYDACGDPVYAAALANAICSGTGQAEQFLEVDGRLERREPSMVVTGSGTGEPTPAGAIVRVVAGDPTRIVSDSGASAGSAELVVLRRLGRGDQPDGATLSGSWNGQATPVPLAYLTLG